jgi:hypothetical protein
VKLRLGMITPASLRPQQIGRKNHTVVPPPCSSASAAQ